MSVTVRSSRAVAFRVFTEEIDQWWRRGLEYRVAGKGRGILHLEPRRRRPLFEAIESRSGRASSRAAASPRGSRRPAWSSSGGPQLRARREDRGRGALRAGGLRDARHGHASGWSAIVRTTRRGTDSRSAVPAHDGPVVGRPPHLAPRARLVKWPDVPSRERGGRARGRLLDDARRASRAHRRGELEEPLGGGDPPDGARPAAVRARLHAGTPRRRAGYCSGASSPGRRSS